LVRLSPFDAAHRRQTSFAGVEVSPVVEETGDVEIEDDDLQVDTYRASGAGGQHVNKTDSAVRITHRPTGIVVQCQNERSQSANRATAMAMLRSKLIERSERERQAEIARERGEAQDVNFGSQIRSYVLHPYTMVKDHRTDFEVGNANGVLDVDKVLDMAQEAGLYVIARPGPYINAEVDGGGFPGWLSTTAGNTRTGDPEYLKWSDEWQTQIDRIIARHQITDGGGSVIAYQVENEYYHGDTAGRAYMQHIEDKARADGITVPLTGNNNGTFNSGQAAL